ncbi:Vacuolar cation-transporting ATPase YPK9 [Cyberlindnera fabianii]|uniref:Cation-transporting ATPase n=1 Tax=Cyberlindnera fabianii TaxID=36022 RepID=A0A1V2L794_CYBFA|nr:Vacuolar cation-transporting ATPase YPK9 [Cyberlindnera fabianii]
MNSRSRSRSRSVDHFNFFDPEDVEAAQGASTMDEDVDYDTNWDDEYRRGSVTSMSVQDYGSIDRVRTNSTYAYRDRVPSDASRALLDDDEMSTDREDEDTSDIGPTPSNGQTFPQEVDPALHEHYFPNYPTSIKFQRFYIAEEDLVLAIAGYKTHKVRLQLYYLFCILTFGLGYLILRWLPKYKFAFYGAAAPLGKAEWVVIETEYGELSVVDVHRQWYNRPLSTIMNVPHLDIESTQGSGSGSNSSGLNLNLDPIIPILISFEYRYLKLYYSPVEDIYKTNTNWVDYSWHTRSKEGLTTDAYEDRNLVFNQNSLDLKEKTVGQLLVDEVLHPFYMFQVFSIILWAFDEYYYYAACIFLISIASIINTLIETKSTMKRLTELSHFQCTVRVWRNGFWKETTSHDLVPGDVYEVSDPSLNTVPCDSVLLSGDAILNESMLTGESVPVSKLPATSETLEHLLEGGSNMSSLLAKSYLFNGTKIIRVRHTASDPALALVTRTGFSTTKGALLRSMLFPKPAGFKFYEDSFKYIGFMFLIACFGFVFSTINFIKLGLSYRIIILRALDIITIVVPPALPATLTIGTSFALSRLRKKEIFCIAPTRVNVGGKLDVMCFDKTGTLTEDGLDVYGVHSAENFDKLTKNVNELDSKMIQALVSCHSLRVVDGELMGDPLDYKMFEFTGWNYEEEFGGFSSLNESRNDEDILPENTGISPSVVYPSGDKSKMLGILKSFEFVSELRRMSVVVKCESNFHVLTKGAPEVIKEICDERTFPQNYEELLHHYTHNGYRVIACAGKPLKKNTWLYSQKISRNEAESGLQFLGFIVFENRLKPSTTGVLTELRRANLRTVMCTGDNLLTAISVGRECGLVEEDLIFVPHFTESGIEWHEIDNDEMVLDSNTLKLHDTYKSYGLAVSGDIFRHVLKNEVDLYSEDYINTLLLKTNIFARMSPDEKHELVEQLQELDYTVGFCGDGANDCGALKAADVGISLSEAEASVAAPFTSRTFEISCVLDVIKQGRASLVTSFSCFQYMSLYSAIQFISVSILYKRGSNLGDFQFLWIDLFLILPLAIFMSWSDAYDTIVPKRPSANLVSPKLLIPLVINIVIMLIFQVAIWQYVQGMPWYIKPVPGGDDAVQSSDNTVLFYFSNMQYILCAITLTVGPPYRESAAKNIPFISNVIVSFLLSVLLMNVSPDGFWGNLFQLTDISTGFKWLIVVFGVLNLAACHYIAPKFKKVWRKRISSKRYKRWLKGQHVVV